MTGDRAVSSPAARVPRRIAVLMGGPSAEHDVSIVSGWAIARALAGAGHDVECLLIGLDGTWWWLPPDLASAASGGGVLPEPPAAVAGARVFDDPAQVGAIGPYRVGAAIDRLADEASPPVVFIALHGPFGEDGTVQALLEAGGLVYTGSGVAASAIGMDKAIFKRLCRGLGLPVVDWREVSARRWAADRPDVVAELEAFASALGDPRLMVKPARLGSSIGITLAHGPAERPAAVEAALAHDSLVLVEAYVAGARDLEVSVIGNDRGRLELYGPGEIEAGREFYDFAAKYEPGLSRTNPVAEVDAAMRVTILKIARDCYRAIGADGFARVDFLLGERTVYLSEINTIPGFTPISLFPAMAAAGGYDFAGVAERIVELAIERAEGAVRRRLVPDELPR